MLRRMQCLGEFVLLTLWIFPCTGCVLVEGGLQVRTWKMRKGKFSDSRAGRLSAAVEYRTAVSGSSTGLGAGQLLADELLQGWTWSYLRDIAASWSQVCADSSRGAAAAVGSRLSLSWRIGSAESGLRWSCGEATGVRWCGCKETIELRLFVLELWTIDLIFNLERFVRSIPTSSPPKESCH